MKFINRLAFFDFLGPYRTVRWMILEPLQLPGEYGYEDGSQMGSVQVSATFRETIVSLEVHLSALPPDSAMHAETSPQVCTWVRPNSLAPSSFLGAQVDH